MTTDLNVYLFQGLSWVFKRFIFEGANFLMTSNEVNPTDLLQSPDLLESIIFP